MMSEYDIRNVFRYLWLAVSFLPLSLWGQELATPEQKAQACVSMDGPQLVEYLNLHLYNKETEEKDRQLERKDLPLEDAMALNIQRMKLKKMRSRAITLVNKQLKTRTVPYKFPLLSSRSFEDFQLPPFATIMEVGHSYYYTLRITFQVETDRPSQVYALYGYLTGADRQPVLTQPVEMERKGKYHTDYFFIRPDFTPQSIYIKGYE